MDILTFNEESLGKLKYVHLQKLAHKHNIRKRWAKKDELVQLLLSTKKKLLEDPENRDNQLNEERETDWMDGASFIGIKPLSNDNEEDSTRGTFTIEKFNDARATYDLTNAINAILPDLDGSLNSRLTFDIPQKRQTPCVSDNVTNETYSGLTTDLSKKKPLVAGAKVKMLTIPYSPVGSRVPISRAPTGKKSIHQLSSKSIGIKKAKVAASPLKLESKMAASARTILPVLTHTTASNRFNGRIAQTTTKGINRQAQELKAAMKPATQVIEKNENGDGVRPERRLSTRRKSKSDDPTARRSLSRNVAGPFLTPPGKGKTAATSQKANAGKLAVSKMPDFARIHEKQFKKMDSLDEYINKKAERARTLWATPLLKRPTEKVNFESSVLKEQNRIPLSGVKEESVARRKILPTPKNGKGNLLNTRNVLNRNPNLRTQTDVKDKNRSHIHGIRTNKRFELQMKFRNL